MANIITNLVIGFLSIKVSQGQNFKWFLLVYLWLGIVTVH